MIIETENKCCDVLDCVTILKLFISCETYTISMSAKNAISTKIAQMTTWQYMLPKAEIKTKTRPFMEHLKRDIQTGKNPL